MERPSKGLTTSLDFSNKGSNNKQKARFAITDITKKDFRKLLKRFNNSSYLGYKSKPFHNELTEAYFFLIKNNINLMKARGTLEYVPTLLNRESMKQLDTSTEQYNMMNCKAST